MEVMGVMEAMEAMEAMANGKILNEWIQQI